MIRINRRRISLLASICAGLVIVSIAMALLFARSAIFGDGLVAIDERALYPVTAIVDGDTFKARVGGPVGPDREITVRVLGIDTPETVHPTKPVGCYGPEASAEAKLMLEGRRVRLVYNPNREKTDKYGRYLMYVYRDDGLFYNERMIQEGYAREYTFRTPYRFQMEFRAAQKAAKAAGKGLWGACRNEAPRAASATAPVDTNRYPRSL